MEPYLQLEQDWAEWNNLDPAGMVVCSSGTAALHLAFEALQLPPGSEVIVPDLTMIACARAVSLAGLVPVFVDCDERLCMDEQLAGTGKAYNEERTRAILFVHVYGRQCSMDRIAWAAVHNCNPYPFFIEDLAEAHGVRPHPQTDAACWSFFKNKIVAGEEGGAVWFHNPAHASLARQLRCLGFTDAHDFMHRPRGHNYRLSNIHASAILRSLAKADFNLVRRREVEAWYDELTPAAFRMPPRDAPWVYDVRIPGCSSRGMDRIVGELRAQGVAARHCFKPCSIQTEYIHCRRIVADRTSQAYAASMEVLYLPLYPALSKEEVARNVTTLLKTVYAVGAG